jgi:DNA-binding NtrC family response regulator
MDDLPESMLAAARFAEVNHEHKSMSLRRALEEPERRIIEAALRANRWNRQITADVLEINRTTLYKKMKRYNLEADPAAQVAESV